MLESARHPNLQHTAIALKHEEWFVRSSMCAIAAEYMALPASQYSVLDAEKIERLDDSTFRCHVGRIGFFSLAVEPVLTVSVVVEPEGPIVKLLNTKVGLQRSASDVCYPAIHLHEGYSPSLASVSPFPAQMDSLESWASLAVALGR